jgi:amino acid adenylation domain-containing protein
LQIAPQEALLPFLSRSCGSSLALQPEESIVSRFDAQVRSVPDRTAIVTPVGHITYAALDELSDRLAEILQQYGVSTDCLVVILLQPSVEMMIGILATLKAGGGFLLLDPQSPRSRLRTILSEAKSRCVITSREQAPPELLSDANVLLIEDIRDAVPRKTGAARRRLQRHYGGQLAYLIYTSGSTGTPKGILISSISLLNHMLWIVDALQLNEDDRLLQKTAASFDASLWEFFAPLFVGGTLVIPEAQTHRDPAAIVRAVLNEAVTVVQLVPTMLGEILKAEGFGDCRSLTDVLCGGEPLTRPLVEAFARTSAAKLYNLYGPAEATIDAIWSVCEPGKAGQPVPIGNPIANVDAYLLDDQMDLVPMGAAGEIFLGGAGLGRGYLNAPALTASKFVPDPFNVVPGARLYRTGDLGRLRPDRSIEFLGRLDNQVKIRGARTEPREIETVLEQVEGILQAAVVPIKSVQGEWELNAFVVTDSTAGLRRDDIRRIAANELPEYMVPARIVLLDALPHTLHGKVDREALLRMDHEDDGSPMLPPQTEDAIQEIVANIWADATNSEGIGPDTHFFHAGGHSIRAIQVVSKINRTFGVHLPLRSIFETPTLRVQGRLNATLDIRTKRAK